jgi:hypothetical protein
MKKLKIVTGIILLFSLTACDDIFKLPDHSTGAENFDQLLVSSGFMWTTSQQVQIDITGLPAMSYSVPVKTTLTIYKDDKIYYTGLHSINENLQLNLSIPSDVTTLNLKFGELKFESEVVEQKASFSFIPEFSE